MGIVFCLYILTKLNNKKWKIPKTNCNQNMKIIKKNRKTIETFFNFKIFLFEKQSFKGIYNPIFSYSLF